MQFICHLVKTIAYHFHLLDRHNMTDNIPKYKTLYCISPNIKHYIAYPTEHETSVFIKYAGSVLHYSEYVSLLLTLLQETCITIFVLMFAFDILTIHFRLLYVSWVVFVHRCFKNTLQIKSEAVRFRWLQSLSNDPVSKKILQPVHCCHGHMTHLCHPAKCSILFHEVVLGNRTA